MRSPRISANNLDAFAKCGRRTSKALRLRSSSSDARLLSRSSPGACRDSARAVGLSKHSFLDYFRKLRGGNVVGDRDLYEFDTSLVMLKDVYFTRYQAGNLHSLPIQLNRKREVIPNIFLGFDILDIYGIDANANTFKSDFYYWIKLDTAFRDAEKYILFQNIKQSSSSRELVNGKGP